WNGLVRPAWRTAIVYCVCPSAYGPDHLCAASTGGAAMNIRPRRFLNRSTLMLTVAVVAGLLAAWSARQHIQGRIDHLESQARVPEVERIVAASNLSVGTRIENEHLAVRRFPAALVPSESLVPARFAELEGRVLHAPLAAGDLVTPLHVRQVQSGAFSTTLPSGRR